MRKSTGYFEEERKARNLGDVILRAADNSRFRHLLLPPRDFSFQTIENLLLLAGNECSSPEKSDLAHISDILAYKRALQFSTNPKSPQLRRTAPFC